MRLAKRWTELEIPVKNTKIARMGETRGQVYLMKLALHHVMNSPSRGRVSTKKEEIRMNVSDTESTAKYQLMGDEAISLQI